MKVGGEWLSCVCVDVPTENEVAERGVGEEMTFSCDLTPVSSAQR